MTKTFKAEGELPEAFIPINMTKSWIKGNATKASAVAKIGAAIKADREAKEKAMIFGLKNIIFYLGTKTEQPIQIRHAPAHGDGLRIRGKLKNKIPGKIPS